MRASRAAKRELQLAEREAEVVPPIVMQAHRAASAAPRAAAAAAADASDADFGGLRAC
jgi:hypothetical protein